MLRSLYAEMCYCDQPALSSGCSADSIMTLQGNQGALGRQCLQAWEGQAVIAGDGEYMLTLTFHFIWPIVKHTGY